MEKDIEQFERIRSYILGKMSAEDAVSFEKDLLHDKELNREYEILKDISKAVVKVYSEKDLRALLSKAEEEYRTSPKVIDEKKLKEELDQVEQDLAKLENTKVNASKGKITFIERVKAWFNPGSDNKETADSSNVFRLPYSSRMALSFAVAAGLALAIILPYNNQMAIAGYNEANSILESGSWRYKTFRGEGSISDMFDGCYEQIQAGNYQDALKKIDLIDSTLDEEISSSAINDSDISRLAELNRAKQEIRWCKAILLMQDKKVGKAKRLLKEISKSEGEHSQEAKRILKEVF